jgi:hypothetical protein
MTSGGSLLVSRPLRQVAWRNPPPAGIVGSTDRFLAAQGDVGIAAGVVGATGCLVPGRDIATETAVRAYVAPNGVRYQTQRSWSEFSFSDVVNLADAEGEVLGQLLDSVVDQDLQTTAQSLACASVRATEALVDSITSSLHVRQLLGSLRALQHEMVDVFIEVERTAQPGAGHICAASRHRGRDPRRHGEGRFRSAGVKCRRDSATDARRPRLHAGTSRPSLPEGSASAANAPAAHGAEREYLRRAVTHERL